MLVLANRVLTCAVAAAVSALSGDGGAGPSPRALIMPCLLVAATNGAATFCQYEALRFVSFAGVTLAKSAKMLPVLLWVRCSVTRESHALHCVAPLGSAEPLSRGPARRARWCCASGTSALTTWPLWA